MTPDIKKTAHISFASMQQDPYTSPLIKEVNARGKKYIQWGKDNQYPYFLQDLYKNSSTHGSIVDGKIDFICGKGLKCKSGNKKVQAFIDSCNSQGDSLNDLFKKITLDFLIYGGFAMQVVYGRASKKIAELNYADLGDLRYVDITNDKGIVSTKLLHSKEWNQKHGTLKVKTYDVFNPNVTKGDSIFYYSGIKTRTKYPVPFYESAITSILTDINVSKYHDALAGAGMFPNMVVTFNNGRPSEEEMEKVESQFTDKFGGSDKAGKAAFIWNEPGETAPSIATIQDNDASNKFLSLAKSTGDKIYAAHRATPSLFGIATEGKLGDNQQLKVSFDIFRKTVVEPIQNELLRLFNKLLSVNFKGEELEVIQIPALLNYFTNEWIIAASMTIPEVRNNIVNSGYLDDATLKGDVIGYKNLPNLNNSDNALADKNAADAEATKNALPDSPTQTPE